MNAMRRSISVGMVVLLGIIAPSVVFAGMIFHRANATITIRLKENPPAEWWKNAPRLNIEQTDQHRQVYRSERLTPEPFVVKDLPAGRYAIHVDGFSSPFLTTLVELDWDNKTNKELVLEWAPCRVSGQVTGRNDPKDTDVISWSGHRYAPGGRMHLDQGNRYAMAGLWPGFHRLCYRGVNNMPVYMPVELKPGDNTLNIELPPCRLEGRIIGAKYEKPNIDPDVAEELGEVHVIPRGTTLSSGNRVAFVHADKDGAFHVNNVPPGDYVVRYKDLLPAKPTIAPGQKTVSVELRPAERKGGLQGAINSEVSVEKKNDQYLTANLLPKDEMGYDITGWKQCIVKEKPFHYELKDVPEGVYGLLVMSADSFENKTVPLVFIPDVKIGDGTTTNLDVKIPGGRLVRIDFKFSGPVPNNLRWSLALPAGGSLPDQALVGSGAEGFVFKPSPMMLPFGDYRLEVSGDKPLIKPFKVEAGDGPQAVTVEIPRL